MLAAAEVVNKRCANPAHGSVAWERTGLISGRLDLLIGGAVGQACYFFQAEDGIRHVAVTGVQTCALPIWPGRGGGLHGPRREPPRADLRHGPHRLRSRRQRRSRRGDLRDRSEERRVGKAWRCWQQPRSLTNAAPIPLTGV